MEVNKTTKSAFIIIVFTLGSKFLGFIREMLIAAKFGSGINTDVFFVSLTATAMITEFLRNTISTTFIPILSDIEYNEGKKGKIKHTNNIINVIFVISIILVVFGLVLSVWGSDVYKFPHQSKFNMQLIRKNLLYADKIASTSNCMAEVTRSLVDTINLDITITPFGVDINKFKRKVPKIEKEEIVIGSIKTLSRHYALDDLIRAIKILRDDLKKENLVNITNKFKVLIFGEGNQKNELIRLTKELKLLSPLTNLDNRTLI